MSIREQVIRGIQIRSTAPGEVKAIYLDTDSYRELATQSERQDWDADPTMPRRRFRGVPVFAVYSYGERHFAIHWEFA